MAVSPLGETTLRAGIPAIRSQSIPIPALPVPALPQAPSPEPPSPATNNPAEDNRNSSKTGAKYILNRKTHFFFACGGLLGIFASNLGHNAARKPQKISQNFRSHSRHSRHHEYLLYECDNPRIFSQPSAGPPGPIFGANMQNPNTR